ncbi:MAG: M10 family metallopeptidase C-terminal domain-containing protein [Pseudobdellovibrionaceae bacterium]|jgi:serralysin|nr:M10 family metallopeptidase C-terminal domain-containing protein [Pseudobdellovibrionaceae bacterium]
MAESTTTLPDAPMGCGCAQCLASNGSSSGASSISSDYVTTATGTKGEAVDLNSGYNWGTNNLKFKFLTSLPSYYSSNDDEANNFQAFNTQMKNSTRSILDMLETFTNIQFTEVTGGETSQITFGQATLPTSVGAWAYYPGGSSYSGDVWTNNYYSATTTPSSGNYGFYTLMHEIGHALGLQHSFTAGLSGDEDTTMYTVMSYDWSSYYASSYMIYDIYALQQIYGVNNSYQTGNTVYVLDSAKAYTIWDAGGTDTFDASAQSSSVTLDLRDGELSSVGMSRNIGIAFNAIIENATGGSGNDVLIGNDANNILTGNNGNDTFIGSDGTDTILGGFGSDRMVYDINVSNFIISIVNSTTLLLTDISGQYGEDTVSDVETFEFNNSNYSFSDLEAISMAGASITSHVDLRILTANGRWTYIDSYLTGNYDYALSDFRYRTDSTLLNLVRDKDSVHDDLTLSVNQSYMSLISRLYLRDIGNLEEISVSNTKSLMVRAAAKTQDIRLDLHDAISTNIITGAGNDDISIRNSLLASQASLHIIYSGDGDDSIFADMTSTRANFKVYLGNGDDTFDRTAFSGYSTLVYGDDGNDTILTGSSNDTLFGGRGDDIISAGAGNDLVNDRIGMNTIDGGEGNDLIYGSGTIYGGDGNDRIYGSTANDIVYGDDGNDFIVSNLGNNILHGGAGDDKIYGSGSLYGDDGNDRITGYVTNDHLEGGAGDDILIGNGGNDYLLGGDGYDYLWGGGGSDTFAFDNLNNVDFVRDFNKTLDILDLSALLEGYDPVSDAISDFLQVTTIGTSTYLQIDVNGATNGENFVDVAKINGLKGAHLQDLLDNGQLIYT